MCVLSRGRERALRLCLSTVILDDTGMRSRGGGLVAADTNCGEAECTVTADGERICKTGKLDNYFELARLATRLPNVPAGSHSSA